MSQEKDKLTDHVYDGIQEYDNPLPPWWVYLFIVTIIWGVLYFFYYDITGIGEGKQVQLYEQEMAEFEEMLKSSGAAEELVLTEADMVVSTDASVLDMGKQSYVKNCVACHGTGGEGGIGPNLTDKFWIHGGEFKNVVNTIYNGVPEKGMTTWRGIMKKSELIAVASYVWSMYGTEPANAKPPQGQEFTRE